MITRVNTIKDPDYLQMKSFTDTYEDMPDGAFFALAEEMHGWEVDDWVWFAELQAQDSSYGRKKGKKGKG